MEKPAAAEPSLKKTKRVVAAENSISSTSSSSNGGEEETNTNTNKEERIVQIKVIGQHNRELTFSVKREEPLQKTFHLYCTNTAQLRDNVQFIYKGSRIYGFHTPNSLKMKKNKTIIINAMTTVHGGGSSLQN